MTRTNSNDKVRMLFAFLLIATTVVMSPVSMSSDINISETSSGIRIGLRTAFQPNLWNAKGTKVKGNGAFKWGVIESNMPLYKKIGASVNVIYVRQGVDGPDEYARVKDIIKTHEMHDIETMIRLIAVPETYLNLSSDEDGKYGYNRKYYEWVSRIVELTRSNSVYYLVGNELERDVIHNTFPMKQYQKKHGKKLSIDFSDYQKVFATARKAIKNIDKDLLVVDHSPGSSSHGVAVAYDLYKDKGFDVAYDFWLEYREGFRIPFNDKSVFKRLMENPDTEKRVEFVRKIYTDLVGVDVFQLHHYRNWKSIQVILDWMKLHMEKSPRGVKPIIATEIGRFYKSGKNLAAKDDKSIEREFPEKETIEYLVKNMTILAANGVNEIVSWGFRKWHEASNVIHLFSAPQDNPKEILPKSTAYAVCTFSRLLGGKRPEVKSGYFNASGITEYRFTDSEGDVSVVWAQKPVSIKQKISPMYIVSATGKMIKLRDIGSVDVDKIPVYLVWKGEVPSCQF